MEGGLGLVNVELWNKYLILKFIWKICLKKTLWIPWAHSVPLKDWWFSSAKIPANASWAWRNLDMLPCLASHWLSYWKCGRNFFRHENWHPCGLLPSIFWKFLRYFGDKRMIMTLCDGVHEGWTVKVILRQKIRCKEINTNTPQCTAQEWIVCIIAHVVYSQFCSKSTYATWKSSILWSKFVWWKGRFLDVP